MLKRIEIRNFKRVQDKKNLFIVPFAIDEVEKIDSQALYYWKDNEIYKYKPLILNNLSQVNYLVGKNGSGKSSVLLLLRALCVVENDHRVNIRNRYEVQNSLIDHIPKDITDNNQGNYIPQVQNYKIANVTLDDKKIEMEINNFSINNQFTEMVLPSQNHFSLIELLNFSNKIDKQNNFLKKLGERVHKMNENIIEKAYKKLDIELLNYKVSTDIDFLVIDISECLKNNISSKFLIHDPLTLGHRKVIYDSIILELQNKFSYHLTYKNFLPGSWHHYGQFESDGEFYLGCLLDTITYFICTNFKYKDKVNKAIFLINEPEINLHAKYQKIFVEYFSLASVKQVLNNRDIQFIISTHSNYLISAALEQNQELDEDLINRVYLLEDGQNTQPDGGPINFSHFDTALSNLGVQPSDLLFANGVIWVEGPSDAIYIEHWLNLFSKDKEYKPKKGRDYTFQMLNLFSLNNTGLSNFWDDDQSNSEVINLLDVNRKFVVIIDNDEDFDRNYDPIMKGVNYKNKNKVEFLKKIKEKKGDLESSFIGIRDGIMDFWLSDSVYSIENYLYKLVSDNENSMLNKPNSTRTLSLKTIFEFNNSDIYSKLMGDFNTSKPFYAKEVCKKFTEFDNYSSGNDELSTKIEALYNTIKSWNKN